MFSNDARIIYSKITDIWITDETEPNLFSTPLYRNNAPLELSWTNPNTGLEEAVPSVIIDVQDSNYFAPNYDDQGVGSTESGNYAGFHLLLDSRIFPAPIDRAVDWTFTVTVEVLYEGWGNDKRRRLVEIGLPLKGGERMNLQSQVEVGTHPTHVQDCPNRENMRWVFALGQQYERTELVQSLADLIQSRDFSVDFIFNDQSTQSMIVNVQNGELWSRMMQTITQKTEAFTNSPYSDLRNAICLDLPADNDPSHTEVLECALHNEPCVFYDGKTLEEQLDQKPTHLIDSPDNATSGLFVSMFAVLLMALFF